MDISQATNKHTAQIKSLVFNTLKEYGIKPGPGSTDKDLDNIEQSYLNNGGYFGVVLQDEQVVATVGIFRIDDDTCELRKMYIDAEHRGDGLGKQLLLHALDQARDLGYQRVVLETASSLTEALGLYKRFGFREFEPTHLAPRCDQAFDLYL